MQSAFGDGRLQSADWDDLRVFLAVARDESLSGAGRRLKLDPATVGRRVARLEAPTARRFSPSRPPATRSPMRASG